MKMESLKKLINSNIFKYLYYINFSGTLGLYLFMNIRFLIKPFNDMTNDIYFMWFFIFLPGLIFSILLKTNYFIKNIFCGFWLIYFFVFFLITFFIAINAKYYKEIYYISQFIILFLLYKITNKILKSRSK